MIDQREPAEYIFSWIFFLRIAENIPWIKVWKNLAYKDNWNRDIIIAKNVIFWFESEDRKDV